MRTIYVDMDGVLADFDRFCVEHVGRSMETFATSAEGWEAVKPWPNLYALLLPMKDAKTLMNGIWDLIEGFDISFIQVEVLTAIPKIGRIPTAKEDKSLWIEANFARDFDAFNIGPLAEHKQYHCTGNDILIDDVLRNIEQWRSKGGVGIHHVNAEQTLKELAEQF